MELSRIWLESPTWPDHLVVALFAVVLPTISTLRWPKRKRRLREDRPGVRPRLYRSTLVTQWGLTAVALAAWVAQGRSLQHLGFGWNDGLWPWVIVGVVAVLMALLSTQAPALGRSPELAEEFVAKVDDQIPLLPRDPPEFRLFVLVALTAGLCEELLYRGFLLDYLGGAIGSWALLAQALAFGLAHLYQGFSGVLKTSALGLILGIIALGSGSLWPAIVLHAFIDFNAARAYRVARRATEEARSKTPDGP